MDYRYKIIISNRNIYREIEISPSMSQIKVGTKIDCDVRLAKNMFFGDIELLFVKSNSIWSIICSDNLYLTEGDVKKMMTRQLRHGDIFEVRYSDSGNNVLFVEFIIDFDNGKVKYERCADVSSLDVITIGRSPNSNICLSSQYTKNDAIRLIRLNGKLVLQIAQAAYGVYHNGRKAGNNEEIENGDFFTLADYFFCYKDGKLWMQLRADMVVNGVRYEDRTIKNGYPRFNRSTRIKTVLNEENIQILDPPTKPEKPKSNIITRLLPSLGMLIAAAYMASKGGATMLIFSGISTGMGILTSVIGIFEGKKEFKVKSAERIAKYNEYIERKREEIENCRDDEYNSLEEIYISQDEEKHNFKSYSTDLFDRRKEDKDFLTVRLGSGLVEAVRKIDYKKQERLVVEDDMQLIPEQLCNEYKYISDAPVVLNLKESSAIGIVGKEENRFSMLKNIIVDVCGRQFFSDVKFAFIANEENHAKIHWLRMLPHVFCDDTRGRLLVYDSESKNTVFEYLYRQLTIRAETKNWNEHILVFFYDEFGFQNHPISKFVDKASELGVTFLFFCDKESDVPLGCNYIIKLEDEKNLKLINTSDSNKTVEAEYPTISDRDAKEIVNLLAPVYTEEISLESSLIKNISLFQLLNILTVDDIDLKNRWKSSNIEKSMAAPIGVSKTETIYLDLHEKAHGPHGLVAGTTGSGKSEILQTYILSMATLFSPYEVGFVIIDFKGGGMVNQFKDLPHLVGAITNIDGKEIERSLRSIKAELQRRQRYFADADVNNIGKYIKKYKAGEVSEPLPHLIIIVDEFAELKAEQPEFMKELISAARIGRSLGVHLILATQKPSGQVNEQIWSNSRFKLCLKVQDQSDSNEVLKSPLAAEIKEPGRAYLQVGNNEIFELFQSAYSGASEKSEEENIKEFSVYSFNDFGKRTPIYVQKNRNKSNEASTQLNAIVRHVHNFCADMNINKLPDICLPPLKEVINFYVKEKSGDKLAIGVYDDPDNQYQGEYNIDLSEGNIMIVGSSQSGKTNLLQSIIRGVSTQYEPEEYNIYILDFSSMILKNYENLINVGGVVTSSEDEKLKNFFKLILLELEERKKKLSEVGVSSYNAYREGGYKELPRILILIDNIATLNEMYLNDSDVLIKISRECISVGITIIMTNNQTSGIGYRFLTNFPTRVAFRCIDKSEYSTLLGYTKLEPSEIAGRCLVEKNKQIYECQTMLSFEGEKEIDRVKAIKKFVQETNIKYSRHKHAKRIPIIPKLMTAATVQEQYSYVSEQYSLMIGLNYSNIEPVTIDFSRQMVIGISGKAESGSSKFIKYLVNAFNDRREKYPVEICIIDNIDRSLEQFNGLETVKSYSIAAGSAVEIIKSWETRLADRYKRIEQQENNVLESEPLLLLISSNSDVPQEIDDDREAQTCFKNIMGKYKNMKVGIIYFNLENTPIPYGAPSAIKLLRDSNNILYFDDIENMKIYDVPYAVQKEFRKEIEPGDAYYFYENTITKIKMVQQN